MNNTEQILNSKAAEVNKHYYHYSSIDKIVKLLKPDKEGNRFIWVRTISQMNDLSETKLHEENGDEIHSFCMCCTESERIPLWYLYSGICGNGARLGFAAGKMLDFLRSIETVYPVVDNMVDYSQPLCKDKDFELLCGWVHYLRKEQKYFKYKGKNCYYKDIDEKQLKTNFFVKNYPWNYESEFRIVIKNNSGILFESVAIPLPKTLVKHIEIMSAPETSFNEEIEAQLISCGIKSVNIKESKLKIAMDLLSRNKDDIAAQIDKWYEEKYQTVICEHIRNKTNCDMVKK